MEKILFAVDELTGLIGAAVKMRPSGSVMDTEVSSLKKKFKDKRSAAGCTGCPSCPIKAAAGRSAPSAVSPERRPRANLISGRIRNGILVQLLQ